MCIFIKAKFHLTVSVILAETGFCKNQVLKFLLEKLHLVEMLQVSQTLQNPPVLPLSVLPADERGTLLRRGPAVDFLLQGKISGPEAVSMLVPHLQEELE